MSPLKIYKASAGSGKTYALTLEYLRLLFISPGRHRHILAVTFTNKAAGEMKMRILTWLHRVSKIKTGEETQELKDLMEVTGKSREEVILQSGILLNTILNDYGYFSVGTIDRFFQTVIRAFTREIGIQPGYNLELDTSRVLGIAVDHMLSNISEDPDLQEWLIRYAEERIEEARNWNFREDIIKLGGQLFREEFQALLLEGPDGMMDKTSLEDYAKKLGRTEREANLKITSLAENAIKEIGQEGFKVSDFSGGSRSVASYFLSVTEDPAYKLSPTRMAAITDASKWLKQDASPAMESLVIHILQPALRQIYETSIVANSSRLIRRNLFTMGILTDIADSVKAYTNERNLFLINDASRFLKGIIGNNPTPFIFERVGNRFEHIMLDEFQDTSLFQWENFKPLIDNSLSSGYDNLVVGDVKQSIYRWRNSDWRILSRDIVRDFSHQELSTITLSKNYRSRENIIRFNNSLFQIAPGLIGDAIRDELYGAETTGLRADVWIDIFENAYRDVVQEIPEGGKNSGGYVECRIYRPENAKDYYDMVLNDLPEQIEALEAAGFKPGEIAILVRKQDEGSMVAKKLLEYARKGKPFADFKLVSNESLIISGNISVRLIIGLLHYFIHPSDPLNRAEVKFSWHEFTGNDAIPLQEVFDDQKSVEALLPERFVQAIPGLKKMPLYELIERIIQMLEIDRRSDDVAYVQALQDLVISNQRDEPLNIYSFLAFWNDKGYKKSVTVSEEMNAIRIMTIHKAKGLEFKAVIVPFCNWEITTDPRKENILWCDTSNTQFEGISLVPLRFGSTMKESVFLREYMEELLKGYLDNLNLLYVALTRAAEALIIGFPEPEGEKLKSVGDLILKASGKSPGKEPCVKGWLGSLDGDHFISGELFTERQHDEPAAVLEFDHYPVFIRDEKLNVKLRSQNYFLDEEGQAGSRIGFGNIMHEIYAKINTVEDVERAVRSALAEGLISSKREQEIKDSIRKNLSRPDTARWFEKGLKVINERDIIDSEGAIYRPDRVVVGNGSTVVIDFKFGDTIKSEYLNQVRLYAGLLKEMGYENVKGFIWYVSLEHIIDIDK